MSDMRHVYNAYSAIYNPEIKKKLEESRDAFSKMNLNQLNDQDLYEVSEEILEKVFFHYDLDVPTAESLIESILSDAIAGDKSPLRTDKIERLTEAFAAAFDRVKEKSIRVAKESYTEYLYKKDQLSRLSNNNDLDLPKKKLHDSLVAEDKSVVKNGLLEIIEKKVAKPDYLDFDKDGDKKESMKKALKDKKISEAMIVTNADKKANTPAYQGYKAGMKNKDGTPKYKAADHMKEGVLVKAAQGVEAVGKKIDQADKAVTKATMNRVVKPAARAVGKGVKKVGMAALRGTAGAVGGAVKGAFQGAGKGIKKGMREELLSSGVFSEHEVTKLIWNEFDTEIEENYRAMRDPEKYEREQDKKLEKDKPYHKRSRSARMADPDRGINSPAFKKFMADRGM